MPLLAEFVWTRDTLMIVMIFALPIIAVVGHFCFKMNKVRSDNELKRSMIERGMSAEEIERVMAAQPRKEWRD